MVLYGVKNKYKSKVTKNTVATKTRPSRIQTAKIISSSRPNNVSQIGSGDPNLRAQQDQQAQSPQLLPTAHAQLQNTSPVVQPDTQPPENTANVALERDAAEYSSPHSVERFLTNIGRGAYDTGESYTSDIAAGATGNAPVRHMKDSTLMDVFITGAMEGRLHDSFGEAGRRITQEPGRVIGEAAVEAGFLVGTMGLGAVAKGAKVGATGIKAIQGTGYYDAVSSIGRITPDAVAAASTPVKYEYKTGVGAANFLDTNRLSLFKGTEVKQIGDKVTKIQKFTEKKGWNTKERKTKWTDKIERVGYGIGDAQAQWALKHVPKVADKLKMGRTVGYGTKMPLIGGGSGEKVAKGWQFDPVRNAYVKDGVVVPSKAAAQTEAKEKSKTVVLKGEGYDEWKAKQSGELVFNTKGVGKISVPIPKPVAAKPTEKTKTAVLAKQSPQVEAEDYVDSYNKELLGIDPTVPQAPLDNARVASLAHQIDVPIIDNKIGKDLPTGFSSPWFQPAAAAEGAKDVPSYIPISPLTLTGKKTGEYKFVNNPTTGKSEKEFVGIEREDLDEMIQTAKDDIAKDKDISPQGTIERIIRETDDEGGLKFKKENTDTQQRLQPNPFGAMQDQQYAQNRAETAMRLAAADSASGAKTMADVDEDIVIKSGEDIAATIKQWNTDPTLIPKPVELVKTKKIDPKDWTDDDFRIGESSPLGSHIGGSQGLTGGAGDNKMANYLQDYVINLLEENPAFGAGSQKEPVKFSFTALDPVSKKLSIGGVPEQFVTIFDRVKASNYERIGMVDGSPSAVSPELPRGGEQTISNLARLDREGKLSRNKLQKQMVDDEEKVDELTGKSYGKRLETDEELKVRQDKWDDNKEWFIKFKKKYNSGKLEWQKGEKPKNKITGDLYDYMIAKELTMKQWVDISFATNQKFKNKEAAEQFIRGEKIPATGKDGKVFAKIGEVDNLIIKQQKLKDGGFSKEATAEFPSDPYMDYKANLFNLKLILGETNDKVVHGTNFTKTWRYQVPPTVMLGRDTDSKGKLLASAFDPHVKDTTLDNYIPWNAKEAISTTQSNLGKNLTTDTGETIIDVYKKMYAKQKEEKAAAAAPRLRWTADGTIEPINPPKKKTGRHEKKLMLDGGTTQKEKDAYASQFATEDTFNQDEVLDFEVKFGGGYVDVTSQLGRPGYVDPDTMNMLRQLNIDIAKAEPLATKSAAEQKRLIARQKEKGRVAQGVKNKEKLQNDLIYRPDNFFSKAFGLRSNPIPRIPTTGIPNFMIQGTPTKVKSKDYVGPYRASFLAKKAPQVRKVQKKKWLQKQKKQKTKEPNMGILNADNEKMFSDYLGNQLVIGGNIDLRGGRGLPDSIGVSSFFNPFKVTSKRLPSQRKRR